MSGAPTVRVAAAQFAPKIADRAANLAAMLAMLDDAADQGVHLTVFPECALPGYCFDSLEEALPHAEPVPGPAVAAMAGACARRGVYAAFGLLERDGDRVFNACALVGPGGLVGSYRKIHLPFMGVDRFATPGDRPLAVLDAGGLRVGLHICYDGAFPEVGRALALAGADLLALPTNWPTQAVAQAVHLMPCRALENVVYALASSRTGAERGVGFVGRSSIAGPGGEVLAQAGPDETTLVVADLDLNRARTKRQVRVPGTQEIDRIADRRPAFYGALVEPNGRA